MNADHSASTLPMERAAELRTVLAAWNSATERLQYTHEALRAEVRRLTDELEVKNRELARKNRLADLGQMASHIAHEVRNNLVPVTLYLSLLRRRLSQDAGSLNVLDKVDAGFVALDATVNDLLGFTSDRDPQIKSFPVGKVVDDVLASLAPQLSAQGIQAITDVPLGMLVQADDGMLRRALLNLTLNALDAMPSGGELTLTVCRSRFGVEFEITDTGPGLTDTARHRAFEPFFTTKSTGTGLGLAIVYRIAEVHHGAILAANCPEGGRGVHAADSPIAHSKGGRMSVQMIGAPPGRPTEITGRVLVVDDHAQARESMCEVLRHAGHQVESCASAVEALQRMTSESFDLIITDLQMPGMTGLEFIRQLEHRSHGSQVVMVTAHATVASAVEAMRRGAFDYIEKPFGADALEQLVSRALNHGHMVVQHALAKGGGTSAAMIGTSRAMRTLRPGLPRWLPRKRRC